MELNVVTALNGSGYGIVGFEVSRALTRAGHDIALFPRIVADVEDLRPDLADLALLRRMLRRQRTFEVGAPCLRIAAENDMSLFAGTGLRAGLTFFETDALADAEVRQLASLDVVLVATEWGREAAISAGLAPDRLRVAPMGVDTDVFAPSDPPADGPTVFLNVGKWERRKGQDVLIEAFGRAFSADDDVELRLLCDNFIAGRDAMWKQEVAASARADKITVLEREPTRVGLAARMAEAHCGVFPARSEGWNLGLVEMLAVGRDVIATDYAAHTQYLTPSNARLISVDEVEDARDDRWVPIYSERGRGRWAHLGRDQLDQLVEHLRAVHQDRLAGRLGRNDAGVHTAEDLSWAATAEAITAALAP